MKSKDKIKQKLVDLFEEWQNPNLSMWREFEIRSQIKILEWVLHNDR